MPTFVYDHPVDEFDDGIGLADEPILEVKSVYGIRARIVDLIPARSLSRMSSAMWFGTGLDGDCVVDDETFTLDRDMYFNNLTITGTGKIDCANYRLFVANTIDLTSAGTGAISANGLNGASATLETTSSLVQIPAGTFNMRQAAGQGRGGSTTTPGNMTYSLGSGFQYLGGIGGYGGKGGGSYTLTTGHPSSLRSRDHIQPSLNPQSESVGTVASGIGGGGGYEGAGGGAGNIGGGGGNGGSAGGVLWIAAGQILFGTNTATGILQANGGNGGDGGNAQGTNASGGGGGGGGGGGFIHLTIGNDDRRIASSSVGRTQILSANGGIGGDSGNGIGTGENGEAGNDGGPGCIFIYHFPSGTAYFDRGVDREFFSVIPL